MSSSTTPSDFISCTTCPGLAQLWAHAPGDELLLSTADDRPRPGTPARGRPRGQGDSPSKSPPGTEDERSTSAELANDPAQPATSASTNSDSEELPSKLRASVAYTLTADDRRQIGLKLADEVVSKAGLPSADATLIVPRPRKEHIESETGKPTADYAPPVLWFESGSGPSSSQAPEPVQIVAYNAIAFGSPASREPALSVQLGPVRFDQEEYIAFLVSNGEIGLATKVTQTQPSAPDTVAQGKAVFTHRFDLPEARNAYDRGDIEPLSPEARAAFEAY